MTETLAEMHARHAREIAAIEKPGGTTYSQLVNDVEILTGDVHRRNDQITALKSKVERLREAGSALVRWFDGDGKVYSPPLSERIEAMRTALAAPSPGSTAEAATTGQGALGPPLFDTLQTTAEERRAVRHRINPTPRAPAPTGGEDEPCERCGPHGIEPFSWPERPCSECGGTGLAPKGGGK